MNFVCIHGHFYQPPRENPWLERIQWQESSHPFHDWNERITAECYGPNAWSRILDGQGQIVDIVNNYGRISFNFGPTLLSWMEENAPEVYQRILQGDQESMDRFGGHGSAIAQAYNHLILPLASARTKRLQVEWGIRDFRHRFGRDPEGMWLPETAVDNETLEVLADHGVRYTLLAPRQAESVRASGESVWHDVSGGSIDPRKAYRCPLSGGRHVDLFFYDGGLAQDVAFKGLLESGEAFADRLLSGLGEAGNDARLVHVATDGESYGHHHRYGDMALAYALDQIEQNGRAQLTNYGEFLALHPPTEEVEIVSRSSWSCAHGVERWRSDCGCTNGEGGDAFSQAWRKPLREALDMLNGRLEEAWRMQAPGLFQDPEGAADRYVDLINGRSPEAAHAFLSRELHTEVWNSKDQERFTTALRMLEMVRQGMLMYTSCGWFFDEISRVEPVQILQYANRAIQLAERECGLSLEADFVAKLREAESNVPEFDTAADIWEKLVAPARLTLSGVGMHYAVYSLFEDFPERMDICNYWAESTRYERFEAGSHRLAMGLTTVRSRITHSVKHFGFAVVYLGQHQIIGQLLSDMSEAAFEACHMELRDAFLASRTADVLAGMQRHFPAGPAPGTPGADAVSQGSETGGGAAFTFWNLFRDEQRKVLQWIVAPDVEQAETAYREIFDRNYNITNVLRSAELPIPDVFARNLEVVINTEIRRAFGDGRLNPRKLEKLALQARKWDVPLDRELIAFAAGERLLKGLHDIPTSTEPSQLLDRINRVFQVLKDLDIKPDLWRLQNTYYQLARTKTADGTPLTEDLMEAWETLGSHLGVKARLEVSA